MPWESDYQAAFANVRRIESLAMSGPVSGLGEFQALYVHACTVLERIAAQRPAPRPTPAPRLPYVDDGFSVDTATGEIRMAL